MVKVSVIVPVYNVEKLLPRCLDSLVKQTLQDIEIICVNDASPDNSLELLRSYQAEYDNIVVIDLKENVRQGGARNQGLHIARGEYVIFIDSDDWVEVDMLEKMYQYAIGVDADVVTCDYDLINQYNQLLGQKLTDQEKLCGEIDNQKRNELIVYSGGVWSHLYKKELLLSNAIFFPEKLFYEDNYFVPITMMYAQKYGHIKECLYHYYQNTDSTTHKKNSPSILKDRFVTLDLLLEYFDNKKWLKDYGEGLYFFSYTIVFNTVWMYLNTYDLIDLKILHDLRKRLRMVRKKMGRNNCFYTRLDWKGKLWQKIFVFSPELFLLLWRYRKKE